MIGLPPFDAGADHETWTALLSAMTDTPVGGPGRCAGVTGLEGMEAGLVPMLFAAVTVNVYEYPSESPVTVQEVAAASAVQLWVPSEAVAV